VLSPGGSSDLGSRYPCWGNSVEYSTAHALEDVSILSEIIH
jgi:hypothetical protein